MQLDERLLEGVDGLLPVSAKTAKRIREYIEDYDETLVALPERTWASSICMWIDKTCEVLIDLWTLSEGRSDLVLSALVSETKDGFQIKIELVYVPWEPLSHRSVGSNSRVQIDEPWDATERRWCGSC